MSMVESLHCRALKRIWVHAIEHFQRPPVDFRDPIHFNIASRYILLMLNRVRETGIFMKATHLKSIPYSNSICAMVHWFRSGPSRLEDTGKEWTVPTTRLGRLDSGARSTKPQTWRRWRSWVGWMLPLHSESTDSNRHRRQVWVG